MSVVGEIEVRVYYENQAEELMLYVLEKMVLLYLDKIGWSTFI